MRIIHLIVMLLLNSSITAQATFNKRVHFDHPAVVMTGVVATDSSYYVTGVIADSIAPFLPGVVFSKFDLDGEGVFHKTLFDSSKHYGMWWRNLALSNGHIVLPGYVIDTTQRLILLGFNEQGDTVWNREYFNPHYPNYADIKPRGGMVATADSGYLVTNTIVSGPLNVDIYLLRVDSNGLPVWDTIFQNNLLDRAGSTIADGEGNFYIGTSMTNEGVALENLHSRINIRKISSEGEVLWEFTTPTSMGILDKPQDMVLLEDGSLIVTSGYGTEIDRPNNNVVYYEKYVFKLSPNGDVVWEKIFHDPEEVNGTALLTNIAPFSDGSGFLLAGTEGKDTLDIGNFAIRGWVSKIDHDGTLLWARRYVGVDSENPRNEINDVKETPDGGFILVGESKGNSIDLPPPNQQAWLLKLNEHGCLIPGCEEGDSIFLSNPQYLNPPFELSIFPNPATEYLNFQLRSRGQLKSGTFRIINASGAVVKSFKTEVRQEDTFILSVAGWPDGFYFFQLLNENGQPIISEKFIKH